MRNGLGCFGLLALLGGGGWFLTARSPVLPVLVMLAGLSLAVYGATGPKEKPKPEDRLSGYALLFLVAGPLVFFGSRVAAFLSGGNLNPMAPTRPNPTLVAQADQFRAAGNWGGSILFGIGVFLTVAALATALDRRKKSQSTAS